MVLPNEDIAEYQTTDTNHADNFNQRLNKLLENDNALEDDKVSSDIENIFVQYAEPNDVVEGDIWFKGFDEYYIYDGEEWQRHAVDMVQEYGLEWNQSNDEYQRLDSAEGLDYSGAIGDSSGEIDSDFDYIAPWRDMKRCNLADDGTVNAYYDEPEFKWDGSNGQVMVEIPKFYYKVENDEENGDNIYRWWVSPYDLEGYEVHPAFIRDGEEKDYIYFAAFEGWVDTDDKLHSIANKQPTTDEDGNISEDDGTIVDFRNYAQARGGNWEQRDFLTTSAIQLLYLVEFGDYNSQEIIGRGIVDKDSGSGNESENTGDTTVLGNNTGMADGENGYTSISYRGIENFWGNIWEWVDGINIDDYEAYVADHNFVSDKFDEHYNSIGSLLSTSDTFIVDIITNGASEDYTFLADEGGGSSSSYLASNWWIDSGERVARFGGRWSGDSQAGAFCWALNGSSSGSSRRFGARLLYIPEKQ